MADQKPTIVYWGLTDDMIAEVGAHDFGGDNGKYAVMPYDGDGNGNFSTIPCRTCAEAKAEAQLIAIYYGVKNVRIV